MTETNLTGMEIAVVGMAGRFPGAANIDEFWQNLKNGVETTRFYSDSELLEAGTDPQLIKNPAYVKTGGSILENKDYFDASFFGYTPVEAQVLDPQTRIFMETAWQALEDGGYEPGTYDGLIGLYAGSAWHFSWEVQVHLGGAGNALGSFSSWLLANRDNLCTLTSYKLGLKGPVIFLKTTCSTSLVAIHLASQAILNGECHMALAGGVSLTASGISGYMYQEGMIQSPDGHCRAFDADAKGTISGEGAGVVLLKRLEDAITDRDHIHAIIKGTAINNDGSRKIGYTAPSIAGQADVIREALTVADVDPETIGYVETHGTGTPVGDPIELEALRMAFDSEKKGFCRIGSVKTNIGHLDAAAGIAGFIKTVLTLKHRAIPPSLLFTTPNPKIDFANTPFMVNTSLYDWPDQDYPLRAGLSSFGIGGTNAHIILQESPQQSLPATPTNTAPEDVLLLLSARSQTALEQMTKNLADYLSAHPGVNLADVAYTLQTGRRAFKYRRMAMCPPTNLQHTIETLMATDSPKVHTQVLQQEQKDVLFMFPGLGGQYVNMGRDLYRAEPVFSQHLDHCFEILRSLTPIPFKEILYPANPVDGVGESAQYSIHAPEIAPVIIFIFEYALAQLLLAWGIRPRAMIGYSFGEYAAACLAGVFSLADTLKIILFRGQLLEQTPVGAMLSVPVPKETVLPFLPGSDLSLAVDNGPSCILAGGVEAVAAFETRMKEHRIICLRLSFANRALHSHLMAPMLDKFSGFLQTFTLNPPQIPYISNVTGLFVTAAEVTQPAYWTAHLAQTVLFADGIGQLIHFISGNSAACAGVFLEVGPGYDLGVLVRHFSDESFPLPVFNLVDHVRGKSTATRYLLNQLGRLWLAGVPIAWPSYYAPQERWRLPLPTYPFEGQSFFVNPNFPSLTPGTSMPQPATGKKPDIADWFHVPSWKRSLASTRLHAPLTQKKRWLLLGDESPLCQSFARQLQQEGQEVWLVRCGSEFKKISRDHYQLNPRVAQDYNTLFAMFSQENIFPQHIVHFWSVTAENQDLPVAELQDLGFYSLFYLAQAVGRHSINEPLYISVVSNQLHRVTDQETLCPGKATLLGAIKVIPREYFNISCRSIDIVLPLPGSPAHESLVRQLLTEAVNQASPTATPDTVIAYRGDYRWVQIFEASPDICSYTVPPALKEGGVYLITGGLGGIGLELAKHLARTCRAKLVLTRRSPFPQRELWEQTLATLPATDPTCQKIRDIQEMEKSGAVVLVANADVADLAAMQAVIAQALLRFGTINGVIHAAGLPDGGVIALRTPQSLQAILAPKVTGTLLLNQVLTQPGITLDFFLLCSSISSIVGTFGQIAYCAANAFLDAFAYYNTHHHHVFTQSLNWDFWQEVGMGAETIRRLVETDNITDGQMLLQNGLLTSEGMTIFDAVLSSPYPQVVISTLDMAARFAQADYQGMAQPQGAMDDTTGAAQPAKLHPRPALSTEYAEPVSTFEKTFADLLQRYFGFQQVGIDDNLFEYGITSLDMIHINNTLKEKVRMDIPIVVMFEYPTIHSLGQYLENRDQNTMKMNPEQTKPVEDLDEVEETLHQSLDMFDI